MTDFQPPPPPGVSTSFWDRELLGLKMKYALPLFGVVIIGGVIFFMWYRNKSAASSQSTSNTTNAGNSTLSASGAQLAAAGLAPYYGTGAPTGGSATSGGSFVTRGDTSYGSGSIPVVNNVNPTGPEDTIASLPETTALQSLGVSITSPTPVSGTWGAEGARQFYSVTMPGGETGYVLAQDLNLQPNTTDTSAYYSGATSLPTGSISSLYQQTGSSSPSYPYLTGYN